MANTKRRKKRLVRERKRKGRAFGYWLSSAEVTVAARGRRGRVRIKQNGYCLRWRHALKPPFFASRWTPFSISRAYMVWILSLFWL